MMIQIHFETLNFRDCIYSSLGNITLVKNSSIPAVNE